MKTVFSILEELEATSGRLAKEAIINAHSTNELLKKTFVAALDPYVDYGVRKFKKSNQRLVHDDDTVLVTFLELLQKLAIRNLSGNAAKDEVSSLFSNMSTNQQKWCERILLKNIRCGVQDSTVNKTWPNLIKGFEVMLAKTLETVTENAKIKILGKVQYPVHVDPKLDGLRCIVIKDNGSVMFYTRNGTSIDTLPTIKKTIENAQFNNVVLDAEALANDWNTSASVMMSSENKKDDSTMVLNVFDTMPLSEWIAQSCLRPYHDRLASLNRLITMLPQGSPVVAVAGKTVENEAELLEFYGATLTQGYEGVMLKALHGTYEFKRSAFILKMKPVMTFEGTIVGVYGGRVGTSREGSFGGFQVLLSNGVISKCGSGFNDEDRRKINDGVHDSFIGRIVEIEGQPDPSTSDGLTRDGKVRFPVFIRYRDASDVDPKIIEAYETFKESRS